jgi:hypothetical protein
MYRLCVEVASNYIRKYARTRGLQLNIPELSHDSSIYAIEQYLKKPGFRIRYIAAYMRLGAIKNMFRDKEWDQRKMSFDDLLLNEEGAYDNEAGPDEGGPGLDGLKARAEGGPQDSRHEPAIIKQGLLFEDTATGEDYEKILV